jgi:predicted small metal-binding protein
MVNFRLRDGSCPIFSAVRGRKRANMERLLRCRDLGVDCDFEACGENAEEVLKTALDHARAIHGLKDILEKERLQARAAVQDAFCVPKGGYNPGGGGLY